MLTATRDDLQRAADQLRHVMDSLWRWHTRDFCPAEAWTPSINAYRLADRVEVCVDLAGVGKHQIDVRVEPGRLVIRGFRHAPEPARGAEEPIQIVGMEIDHGPFCRIVPLPAEVELSRVTSEHVNGLLWIRLPLRSAR